ncbi:MAG: anion permease [Clostridiales bacterium]|nr:anion permease [Clostridiales bacterium]
MKHFSFAGTAVMLFAAAVVMILRPFELDAKAHFMLGGILIALCVWIFKPLNLSYGVGGLFLAAFSLVIGISPATVFSGFTQNAMWTLIPAFFFGYTLSKTGLGKRIAMAIIMLCKPTYTSLVLAWLVIGIALSILTPAITVRVAIVIPIAVQCCELCKLEKGSKGNSLILLTALSMAMIPGAAWLTGLIWGPFIQGLMDSTPGTEGLVTFGSWFGTSFVYVAVTTVLLIIGSLIIFKPSEKISATAIEEIKNQPKTKMSVQEIFAAIILLAVFLALVTSGLHGLSVSVICITATVAFFLFGVLDSKEFNVAANWDLVIFMAMALAFGAIFVETGISDWLAGIIVPALRPIAGNPWLFMFGIMTVMFLWRFVDVAIFIPTIAIMVPILPAIQEAYGISPLLWPLIFVMAGNAFFIAYQNIWAVMGVSISGERAWTPKHLSIYGLIYFAACLLALFAAIPLWINQGLLGGVQ